MGGRVALDMTGQRFGHLVVERRVDTPGGKSAAWVCRCDCGNEHRAERSNLLRGTVGSCGCMHRVRTHGEAKKRSQTKEYRAWCHIIERCENHNCKRWADYGGRGISMCRAWRESFERFVRDVGRAPTPKHSIDRIDVNGNYEPGNVRWADAATQARNQRRYLASA